MSISNKTFKVLLTEVNTAWGVIVKEHSPNQYKHTINFPDQSKRDEFIGYNLFNGDLNWKDRFNNIKPQYNSRITEIDAELTIDLVEQGYTFEEVINKDFCILEQTNENGSKEYFYYTIVLESFSLSEEGIVTFKGELDILFTYDIKTRNNTENYFVRSHTNRYECDSNKQNCKYIFNGNNLSEPKLSGNIQPNIRTNFKQLPRLYYGTNDTNIINVLKKTRWLVAYIAGNNSEKTKLNRTNVQSSIQNDNSLNTSTRILIVPVLKDKALIDAGWRFEMFTNNNVTPWNTKLFSDKIDDNNNYTWHDVPEFPLDYRDFGITVSGNTIRFSFTINDLYNIHWNALDVKQIKSETQIRMIIETPKPTYTPPTQPVNILNETKLYSQDFFKIEYGNSGSQSGSFPLDYLSPNNLAFPVVFYYYTFSNQMFQISLITQEYDNSYNIVFRNGYVATDPREYGIATSAYKQYMQENRIASAIGIATSGRQNDKGIYDGSAVRRGAVNELAHRADLKRMPDTQKGVGSDWYGDFYFGGENGLFYTWNTLDETSKKIVHTEFLTKGYQIERLENFNDMKETRYYYNYIQCRDIFNTIDLQISPRIKQIISEAFEQGVTLWHYRDQATWQGILVYGKENTEMDLYAITK